ncbi:hypothetical protein K1720_03240 [Thermococcus argininiproducens]|uniref:Uncharacterized protein n=1 Tax=Thermococcus argininiproducens TaxID=2866384 RepID=A0A9E7MC11_9EURY|nr:hypothetical protein [Thermococcus argininiproducens]USH00488.1 hypothetical protein K1720_03240 [Thermococcus argininiproducens]
MKDSIDVALELKEKEVYSHIAHESAEDMIRIISSIDAERAKNRGEIIHYEDDWDDLMRQRVAKGKRHTAFDFYNPALLTIWENKVRGMKKVKNVFKLGLVLLGIFLVAGITATIIYGELWVLIPLSLIPMVIFLLDYKKNALDLGYYQLTQLFIEELKELLKKYELDPERYKFKIFNHDYFGVLTKKIGTNVFAMVKKDETDGKR